MNRLDDILQSSKLSSSQSTSSNSFRSDRTESNMRGIEDSDDHVSFEHKFCSNFFCCNMRLSGMHELLEHVEEVHIVSSHAANSPNPRPSHHSTGHSSPHRSSYDVVCAYPAPSTPPPLSQLFENEFDWSSTVYPDSQLDSPLMDVFSGMDEFSSLEDTTYSGSPFPHHPEQHQNLVTNSVLSPNPSHAQTSPIPKSDLIPDSDATRASESAKDSVGTATSGVTFPADDIESMQKSAGSSSGPGICNASAIASTSGPSVAAPSTPAHSTSSSSSTLLFSLHDISAPLAYSSVYSSQSTAPYHSYFPADAVKSSSTSDDQKARSSGPCRRVKTKSARKASVVVGVGTGTSSINSSSINSIVSGSGVSSVGSFRPSRWSRDTSRNGDLELENGESSERTSRKGRPPTKREKKHRCPMPGCSKAYLNPGGLKYHLEKGTCKIEPEQSGNADTDSVSKDEPTFTYDLSTGQHTNEDDSMDMQPAYFSSESTEENSPFISASSLPSTCASLRDTQNHDHDAYSQPHDMHTQDSQPHSPPPSLSSSPVSSNLLSLITRSFTPDQLGPESTPSPADSNHPVTPILHQPDVVVSQSHSRSPLPAHVPHPHGYGYPQQTVTIAGDAPIPIRPLHQMKKVLIIIPIVIVTVMSWIPKKYTCRSHMSPTPGGWSRLVIYRIRIKHKTKSLQTA
ncbi:hypothetical protein D9758_013071 [Tetrapyrgos nigripes]|uniref:C2H2-type domain-containing protein n=1 Tax=Tetrapyrgos nigripes TaxID=182062 RepID=A0A8H5FQS5_9AGAR|nr:hypothetical protein D9758_013071 [Tetrapyrgos nigripes]